MFNFLFITMSMRQTSFPVTGWS